MKTLLFATFFFIFISNNAQVGIGTTEPKGALDVQSSNQGLVVPRVDGISNITSGDGNPPENGTIVYDTSTNSMCFFGNNNWVCINTSTGNTTTIELEPQFTSSSNLTYIKSPSPQTNEMVGLYPTISISTDGNTLAYGADLSSGGGAVYVLIRSGELWVHQALITASNIEIGDSFGSSVSVSADGNTLAAGARSEDSAGTGVNSDFQNDNSKSNSGAAYIFIRSGSTWVQQAYIKASNTDSSDFFGSTIAISGNGDTVAVGAKGEDSPATGVNDLMANQLSNINSGSGAVYVFIRSGTIWSQQAYIKASNPDVSDLFGDQDISISDDGNTLAVGARFEDSNGVGVNSGSQTNNSVAFSGAVYVFTRSGTTWSQEAYIKASNTDSGDYFGRSTSLSGDGNTLAVGATSEDSSGLGVNNSLQNDNNKSGSGAVYLFTRSGSTWVQQAYIKASNTDSSDSFGFKLSLSEDGVTLAVGAFGEDSSGTGINSDNELDNSFNDAGAVYVFTKDNGFWEQEAYIKASNPDSGDFFGQALSISGDGNTLSVCSPREDSNGAGVNSGAESDNSLNNAGAIYVYEAN